MMATKKSSDIAEKLDKEITCGICHQHYNEPKVLPCCHYFCKGCINQLKLKSGTDNPFSCPKCSQETTLPQGDADHLKTAFFINRMKEMHFKMERVHGKVKAKCEQCSGGKAEAFCRQCAEFICTECVIMHKKLKIYSGHNTITLDELKEGGAGGIVVREPPLKMCTKHDESMKIYCFTCSCLICRDCTIKDHSGHNHEFMKSAAPEMKKKLVQQLDPLKKVEVSLSHAVEEIQNTKSKIEAQGDSVANKIKNSFAEYRKIVEKREQELLKEAATKVTQKLENLSGQEKSLSTERAVVQSVIDYTEQCVEHSTDDEIMCMHDDIQSRIDREIKEHNEEGTNLEPMEEVDVGVEVSCADDLQKLFQNKTRLTFDCPIKFKLIEKKAAKVNQESEFSLRTNLSTKGKYAVECQLKSLSKGSIVKCKVDLIKGNEYRICFTPSVHGHHELPVIANGQEVAGSPFPVFVSIDPTQLSSPVRVITGVKSPMYVAVNSVGEMIVSKDDSKDVVILSEEGKKKRSVKESNRDIDIKDPTGVAVDDADNIYIADSGNNKIIKLDKDIKMLNEIYIKQDSSLSSVSLVGDEVRVCDKKNKCILVYTKKLEYVRQSQDLVQCSDIHDISSDEQGNLYICERGNSRIHVLGNDGEYLRKFGSVGSYPSGICVTNQYVYVACYGSNNIYVFNAGAGGGQVRSFGTIGSGGSTSSKPKGMCMDKDGFLYVCDYDNNRVQVF